MNRIFQNLHFQNVEETVLIDGAVGQLELKIRGLSESLTPRGVGVICHPHPLQGGTMENKVVSTLARAFHEAGFMALRFNFRGVGVSEGQYAEGLGELDDLIAVIRWVQTELPALPISIAGFSFGAAIAAAYARDHAGDIQQVILVSPALGAYSFGLQDRIAVPSLVIQGDADEVLAPDVVYRWAQESPDNHVRLVRFADTGHFYHGKLTQLKSSIVDYLSA